MPSEPELVAIGRVGRSHGLDGSFFVEGPSDRPDAFARGAVVYVDGVAAKIVASKRGSQNRPVIRLERRVERGAELAVSRASLPPLGEDEYYAFQLVGLEVVEEGGRSLGRVAERRIVAVQLQQPTVHVADLRIGIATCRQRLLAQQGPDARVPGRIGMVVAGARRDVAGVFCQEPAAGAGHRGKDKP